MKIVIAPDSYKESLSALEVAGQIEAGFRTQFPDAEYIKLPVADGGEGTVEAMVAATAGRMIKANVIGPLGDEVDAFYGVSGDEKCAFIEMAAASGLELVPPPLHNPLKTTSYGTGELIGKALNQGVKHIIIGIGGSATNDGGAGGCRRWESNCWISMGSRLVLAAVSWLSWIGLIFQSLIHVSSHAESRWLVISPTHSPAVPGLLLFLVGRKARLLRWLPNWMKGCGITPM